jgi:hypothetical protein
VFALEHNELVRVVVTQIEWDGAMQRRMVDTAHGSGGPQWEDLAARALAVPAPYRPVPGTPVYHVGLDDGTAMLVAEHDLCGPLLDLVTAVLAMGDALLTRAAGFANRSARPSRALTVVSQTGGTAPDSDVRTRHLQDADLRIRMSGQQAAPASGRRLVAKMGPVREDLPVAGLPGFERADCRAVRRGRAR